MNFADILYQPAHSTKNQGRPLFSIGALGNIPAPTEILLPENNTLFPDLVIGRCCDVKNCALLQTSTGVSRESTPACSYHCALIGTKMYIAEIQSIS